MTRSEIGKRCAFFRVFALRGYRIRKSDRPIDQWKCVIDHDQIRRHWIRSSMLFYSKVAIIIAIAAIYYRFFFSIFCQFEFHLFLATCPLRVTHAPATISIFRWNTWFEWFRFELAVIVGPNPKRESIHSAFVRNVFAACSVTELISI